MKPILKKQLTISDILLILTNLVPLWGVWFNGWNVRLVFVVYCLESVIVGLYNIIQLWFVAFTKGKEEYQYNNLQCFFTGLFFVAFFIIHYGIFIVVQLGIFLALSAGIGSKNSTSVVQLVFSNYTDNYAFWLIACFTVAYGLGLVKDFFLAGKYRTTTMQLQMLQPYKRIFIQQFAVIFGAYFLMFGAGKIFMLIFVVFKIVFGSLIDYKMVSQEKP